MQRRGSGTFLSTRTHQVFVSPQPPQSILTLTRFGCTSRLLQASFHGSSILARAEFSDARLDPCKESTVVDAPGIFNDPSE
jgi:hypothetical protein